MFILIKLIVFIRGILVHIPIPDSSLKKLHVVSTKRKIVRTRIEGRRIFAIISLPNRNNFKNFYDSIRISIKSTLRPLARRASCPMKKFEGEEEKGSLSLLVSEREKEELEKKEIRETKSKERKREKEAYYSRAQMECERQRGGGRSCSQAWEETL